MGQIELFHNFKKIAALPLNPFSSLAMNWAGYFNYIAAASQPGIGATTPSIFPGIEPYSRCSAALPKFPSIASKKTLGLRANRASTA